MVKRSAEELDALADRLEREDEVDPARVQVDRPDDLREVAESADAVAAAEARLTEAVQVARAHDRSWVRIAVALGVTRQAAQQRFGRLVDSAK